MGQMSPYLTTQGCCAWLKGGGGGFVEVQRTRPRLEAVTGPQCKAVRAVRQPKRHSQAHHTAASFSSADLPTTLCIMHAVLPLCPAANVVQVSMSPVGA